MRFEVTAALVVGMTGSFAYQIEATLRGVYLEPRNTVVLVFKMILWSACVTSLVFALRCAVGTKSSRRNEMPDQSARANAGTALRPGPTSDVRQKNHG